ncbi:MAG: hypothetical protein EA403_10795, partial [Spirochaetaceae bacterium]
MSAAPLRRSARIVDGPLVFPSPGGWWRSLRAYSFTASLAPVLLAWAIAAWWSRSGAAGGAATAGANAAGSGTAGSGLALWTVPFIVLAAVLFHAGTNVLNDFYDYVHGVDPDQDPDPTHAITQGVVSPRFMRF